MKTCSVCGVEKENSEFAPQQLRCKPCKNIYLKEYRERNKDKIKASYEAKREHKLKTARNWKAKNPDKTKATRGRHRLKAAADKLEKRAAERRPNLDVYERKSN